MAGEHVSIREEAAADAPAVHDLLCQAFGQDAEARLVDALRVQGQARLALVAQEPSGGCRVGRRVVGHILFSDLAIQTPGESLPALALAPLAVAPDRQRQGIGTRLVQEGLRLASERGHRIVIVVGHPEFYPRFGFSTRAAAPLRSAYQGPAFLALALEPGALDEVAGDVVYAPSFSDL